MSRLSELSVSTAKSKKRPGRGYGSGIGGHTSGRGTKGQLARRGAKVPLWFEGGQLPLIKRLPMQRGKGGLKPTSRVVAATLRDINSMKAETITVDTLKLEKIIPLKAKAAKIIATGVLERKVIVKGLPVSQKAREAIEKAGGTVE